MKCDIPRTVTLASTVMFAVPEYVKEQMYVPASFVLTSVIDREPPPTILNRASSPGNDDMDRDAVNIDLASDIYLTINI